MGAFQLGEDVENPTSANNNGTRIALVHREMLKQVCFSLSGRCI